MALLATTGSAPARFDPSSGESASLVPPSTRHDARDLTAASQILCVQSPASATGAPCTNATSFATVQDAVNAASPGDEVRIATGSYTSASGSVASIEAPITLSGGFAGGTTGWAIATGAANSTVLAGSGSTFGLVLQGATTVVVQNLAVSGGIQNPSGTVDVASGSLVLENGGTTSGAFTVEAGATIAFPAGAQTLAGGTTFGGAGLVDLNGGTLTVGTASGDAVTVQNFQIDSGTLNGAGALTITGPATWNGGTLTGAGTTTVAASGSLTLAGLAPTVLDGRSLVLNGPTILAAANLANSLSVKNGATLVNNAVLTMPQDVNIGNGGGAASTLTNNGTITKTAGTGTNQIAIQLNNTITATLAIQSGTIALNGGGTNAGTLAVSSGATLGLSSTAGFIQTAGSIALANQATLGGPLTLQGGVLAATGPVAQINGTVTVEGSGGFVISPGTTLHFANGTAILVSGPTGGRPGASLNLLGTSTGPITLASANGSAGQWQGIWFQSGSTGVLDHVHVSGAGACCLGGLQAGLLADGASPTIGNSAFDSISGNEVAVAHGGLPVLHNNLFGAVFGGDAVLVSGWTSALPQVDATNNWWGSPSGPAGPTSGTGVPVSTGVFITPWLCGPLVDCTPTPTAVPTTSAQLSQVTAQVFPNTPNSSFIVFDAAALPSFTQTFPVIDFNPPSGTVTCSNSTGAGTNSRPMVDVIPLVDGSCSVITFQGNGLQAGMGATLSNFQAAFLGSLAVAGTGTVTFNVTADDGWVIAIGPDASGNQPVYESGWNFDEPAVSPRANLPVLGAYNYQEGATPRTLTVFFPSAGTYPIELDYNECCGGPLSFTANTGSFVRQPVPTATVTLTPTSTQTATTTATASTTSTATSTLTASTTSTTSSATTTETPTATVTTTPTATVSASATQSASGSEAAPTAASNGGILLVNLVAKSIQSAIGWLGGSSADASGNPSVYLPYVANRAAPGATSAPTPLVSPSPTGGRTTASATPTSTASATPTATARRSPTIGPSATSTGFVLNAPPIDRSVSTNMSSASQFLYTGPSPVQSGVTPTFIVPQRVAVVRGNVRQANGAALPDVTIAVLNHPEFGSTTSQADGSFSLALNGGGPVTISYTHDGYPEVERQLTVPWQDYVWAPDVVMLPYDPAVTAIDLTSSLPIQVARGSVISDADGTRQATLFFPQGTSAVMTLSNGVTQTLTTLHVRATEFTVGSNGPNAMPGQLPVDSGYTYATEFSVDEAMQAGATRVQFSPNLVEYLENFVGFPVGGVIPVGYYDRTRGTWVASQNGLVVDVLSVTNGAADLDVDGSGQPASASALAALGIVDAERTELAQLYQPGQSLWRVSLPHFSGWSLAPRPGVALAGSAPPPPGNPWDYNGGTRPKPPAIAPTVPLTGTVPTPLPSPCVTPSNSTIECENQVLDEAIGLAGVPFALHYKSDRVPDYQANTMVIPLTTESISPSMSRIDLQVQVAGQLIKESFTPGTSLSYTLQWNGLDGYGRPVQGAQPVSIQLGYVYPATYGNGSPCNWNQFGHFTYCGTTVSQNPARTEITLWEYEQGTVGGQSLGTWDARTQGLGGWTLDDQNAYDPVGQVLYLGDGTRESAQNLAARTLSPAVELGRTAGVAGLAVGPDGTVYVAASNRHEVLALPPAPGATPSVVAGTGVAGFSGDGGPATQAQLNAPHGLAVGPDGSLYIADQQNNRVRKLALDGTISTVAGNGTAGFAGDAGPATQGQLAGPMSVAVAADGTLYVADTGNNRVRQVGTDGVLSTAAGTGAYGSLGDGGSAALATLSAPVSVAVDPTGNMYIVDQLNQRVREVGGDGVIHTVAGNGTWGFSGDTGTATTGQISQPGQLSVASDGSLYLADFQNFRLRSISPSGTLSTVAGVGPCSIVAAIYCVPANGSPATRAPLDGPGAVAVAPNGVAYVANYFGGEVYQISPTLPAFTNAPIAIPSDDGSELYEFDSSGRQQQILNALTGAVLYSFGYDAQGHLSTITDANNNVTTIEHDASGNPTAIDAPFGQRTLLAVDANGFLASATDPAGNVTKLTSSPGGLLTQMVDPNGNPTTYTYDPQGRLLKDADSVGGSTTLARVDSSSGYTVTMTSALGRASTHQVQNEPTGGTLRTATDPSGLTSVGNYGADGTRQVNYPDGSAASLVQAPDPRFGMQAPVDQGITTTLPSSLQSVISESRSAVLSDPTNPLSLTSLTDATKLNGNTATTVYAFDGTHHTITDTSPAHRTVVTTLDSQGRPTIIQPTNLAPANLTYDTQGRLETTSSGNGDSARVTGFSYAADGYLQKITNAVGQTTSLNHDAIGQVTSAVAPDGSVTGFTYDHNGNLSSLTPPGQPSYRFTYTPTNLIATSVAPAVGATPVTTTYTYNADRDLTGIALPAGDAIGIGYDLGGRVSTVTIPRGEIGYSYDSQGNVHSITAPGGISSSLSYDGFLPTSESWSGPVTGTVSRQYNTNFQVSSVTAGGTTTSQTYDADGLLTGSGAESLTPDPQTGLLSATTLGNVSTSLSYDTFGELSQLVAKNQGQTLFSAQYGYDALGRVINTSETIAGATTTYTYTYDLAGRLSEADTFGPGGSTRTTYGYDPNGNRLSMTGPSGTLNGTYDAQDRITQYGSTTYTFDPNGNLQSKTSGSQTTSYVYDELGNLLQVNLPDGTTISYLIDGQGRRVAKEKNGVVVAEYLYDRDHLIAQLDGSGNVVGRFVYGDQGITPDYLVQGSTTYRIISDHLGSPRLVVNTATGAIAEQLTYDEFGNVILDTNPGFLPFGFAGGLYDSDTMLLRFGRRDYDSQTGRWTARDPIGFSGGQPNLYSYVGDDPVNWIDPSGQFNWGQCFSEGISNGLSSGPAGAFAGALATPVVAGLSSLLIETSVAPTFGLYLELGVFIWDLPAWAPAAAVVGGLIVTGGVGGYITGFATGFYEGCTKGGNEPKQCPAAPQPSTPSVPPDIPGPNPQRPTDSSNMFT
jgi:RHS repeat-associated protein